MMGLVLKALVMGQYSQTLLKEVYTGTRFLQVGNSISRICPSLQVIGRDVHKDVGTELFTAVL